MDKCPSCNGTGILLVMAEKIGDVYETKCEVCGGTGKAKKVEKKERGK